MQRSSKLFMQNLRFKYWIHKNAAPLARAYSDPKFKQFHNDFGKIPFILISMVYNFDIIISNHFETLKNKNIFRNM